MTLADIAVHRQREASATTAAQAVVRPAEIAAQFNLLAQFFAVANSTLARLIQRFPLVAAELYHERQRSTRGELGSITLRLAELLNSL